MLKKVLIPAFILALAAAQPALASNCSQHGMNLAEKAASAGIFNTLIAAAEAAGLVDVLATGGPLTVFAPTDDAFAALPEGTVENLLQNPNELAKVLKYHLVPGSVLSGSLNDGASVITVLGPAINVSTEGGVFVGGAQVTKADVEASTESFTLLIACFCLQSKKCKWDQHHQCWSQQLIAKMAAVKKRKTSES